MFAEPLSFVESEDGDRAGRALDEHAADDRPSALDWTIARPPRLTNGSDERYRAERDALPAGGRSMSFRAVAAFIVDAVERRNYMRETVGLTSTNGK